MKVITLVVPTTQGARDVKAYLPFEGAEFCTHRQISALPDLDGEDWKITHVRTGYAIPTVNQTSRALALDLCDRLSRECPAAAEISRSTAKPNGKYGASQGPIDDLAKQVKAVLGMAA